MSAHKHAIPQYYLTAPAPCPYVKERQERKLFTRLDDDIASEQNEALSEMGFRRSQRIAYRPACAACNACIATRILVERFKPSRNMRRIINKNKDLTANIIPNQIDDEQYELFTRYLNARHTHSGMGSMSFDDYKMMVEDSNVSTFLVEFRKSNLPQNTPVVPPHTPTNHEPLIAVSLVDQMHNGLSMVYSFFDPQENHRSLGTYMILDHIQRSKSMGLAYCHLGYWVKPSSQMSYKARFLPQERFMYDHWVEYNE